MMPRQQRTLNTVRYQAWLKPQSCRGHMTFTSNDVSNAFTQPGIYVLENLPFNSIRFDLSYGNKQAQYEILKGLNISNCRINNPSEAEGAAAATQDL